MIRTAVGRNNLAGHCPSSTIRTCSGLSTCHSSFRIQRMSAPNMGQRSKRKRGPWSHEEDQYLLQLIDQLGASNWVRIANMVQYRSAKQCRERYHQNLKPSLNHGPITPEEGEVIERLVHEMGKRWAEIARRMHGRSDNAVKNWWNGGFNRRGRHMIRRPDEMLGTSRNVEPLSYHHPAAPLLLHQPQHARTSNHVGGALVSPATSDTSSMASSIGEVPSLVSDAGTCLSTSSPNTYPMPQHFSAGPITPSSSSWRRALPPAGYPSGVSSLTNPYDSSPMQSNTHSKARSHASEQASGLVHLSNAASMTSPAQSGTMRSSGMQSQQALPSFTELVNRAGSPPRPMVEASGPVGMDTATSGDVSCNNSETLRGTTANFDEWSYERQMGQAMASSKEEVSLENRRHEREMELALTLSKKDTISNGSTPYFNSGPRPVPYLNEHYASHAYPPPPESRTMNAPYSRNFTHSLPRIATPSGRHTNMVTDYSAPLPEESKMALRSILQ